MMDYEKAASYWTDKMTEDGRMEPEALQERIDAFLARHRTCALAVASGDFVRCTPIEYNYVGGCFYLFSEGGLKFKALKDNRNVCLSVYDEYEGFGTLNGLQVTGKADLIEPWCEEYLKLVNYKKLPIEAMKKLPSPMHLIRIVPTVIDFLSSDLKKEGYAVRQQLIQSEG